MTEKNGKKEGNKKIQKLEYLENKKLFRWNKKHFSKFLKGYNLVKNKNLIKNSGHKLLSLLKCRFSQFLKPN